MKEYAVWTELQRFTRRTLEHDIQFVTEIKMECEQNKLTMYGNCDDENMRKQKANFNNPVDFKYWNIDTAGNK